MLAGEGEKGDRESHGEAVGKLADGRHERRDADRCGTVWFLIICFSSGRGSHVDSEECETCLAVRAGT